jgi:FkbM family methyltransferase
VTREATTARLAAEILGVGATTVLDVGARWGAGGVWWRLDPVANLVGFDPDPVECARLNGLLPAGARERFVPVALGRTPGPATLHITLEPGCSSVFPPDERLADRFPGLSVIKVARRETIQLETLDNWAAAEGIDEITFAKLDTQGCELDILRGGEQALDKCLGLEVEVEFATIYQGAPLFAEVDTYLRSRGFALWRLSGLYHYSERCTGLATGEESVDYSGFVVKSDAGNGRLWWGNAIYLRDFRDPWVIAGGARRLLLLASLLDARGDVDGAAAALKLALEDTRFAWTDAWRAAVGKRVEELLFVPPWPPQVETPPVAPPAVAAPPHRALSGHHFRRVVKRLLGRAQ